MSVSPWQAATQSAWGLRDKLAVHAAQHVLEPRHERRGEEEGHERRRGEEEGVAEGPGSDRYDDMEEAAAGGRRGDESGGGGGGWGGGEGGSGGGGYYLAPNVEQGNYGGYERDQDQPLSLPPGESREGSPPRSHQQSRQGGRGGREGWGGGEAHSPQQHPYWRPHSPPHQPQQQQQHQPQQQQQPPLQKQDHWNNSMHRAHGTRPDSYPPLHHMYLNLQQPQPPPRMPIFSVF